MQTIARTASPTAPRRHTRAPATTRRAVVGLLLLTSLVAGTAHAQIWDGPVTDVELMREALYSCRNLAPSRRGTIDLTIFQQMLDLERRYGVPEEYRGMTVAKGCIESGYTPDIAGDCETPDKCKAVGMLQLWPWTTRFGVDRTDPVDSARFLLERVQIGLQGRRLRRICPNLQSPAESFRIAWLRINRGPLIAGRPRCFGTPHGLTRLRQWKKNIYRKRYEHALAQKPRPSWRRAQADGPSPVYSAAASIHPYRAVVRR